MPIAKSSESVLISGHFMTPN